MFKSVMVPLDGTPFSEQILPIPIDIVRRSGGQLAIVRVVAPARPTVLAGGFADDSSPDYSAETLAYLRERSAEVAGTYGVYPQPHLLYGSAAGGIARAAVYEHCELLVMRTHARRGWQRTFLGSVADVVLRQAPCPVLLMRDIPASADGFAFKHILVPLDGSGFGEKALPHAMKMAMLYGSRVTLLSVAELASKVRAYTYLDFVAERLEALPGGVATALRISRKPPAEEILEYARWNGVDLIAIATHGHGALHRLMTGSVAYQVAHEAEVPVLVAPAMSP
jgi:nucleotide-binding universal stress UspA family protein